jgi:hypothetical protein
MAILGSLRISWNCPHRSGNFRSGDRLAKTILLSDNEWAIWETHQQPVRFLAEERFAVKRRRQSLWHGYSQWAGV